MTADGTTRSWSDRFREHLQGSRRLDETAVDRLVAEAEAHCAEAGRPAQDVFGPPEQHARRIVREQAPRPVDTLRENAPLGGIAAGSALLVVFAVLVTGNLAWSIVPGVSGGMLLWFSLQEQLLRRRRRANTGAEAAPADRWTWRLEGVLVGRHGMPRPLARRRAAAARTRLSGAKEPEEELGTAEQYASEVSETSGEQNYGWLRLEITAGVVAAFQLASFLLGVGPQPNGWETWSYLGIGMVCAVISVWAYHRDQARRLPR